MHVRNALAVFEDSRVTGEKGLETFPWRLSNETLSLRGGIVSSRFRKHPSADSETEVRSEDSCVGTKHSGVSASL